MTKRKNDVDAVPGTKMRMSEKSRHDRQDGTFIRYNSIKNDCKADEEEALPRSQRDAIGERERERRKKKRAREIGMEIWKVRERERERERERAK